MVWSNAARRAKFTAEKSHSLSFAVRVEDRLHVNIIQPTDECWFTVRPVEFTTDFDDTDITLGTDTVLGNGIRASAVITGTGEATTLEFDIQAAEMNLDPDLDYWYDITYVRDNYSVSVAAGVFKVLANVTNRGASQTAYTTGHVFQVVASVEELRTINLTTSMPMPKKMELRATAPIVGTWALGSRVENSEPAPGEYLGWICTTAGTPGVWKGYGLIQA